jgi:hypothetical protein
VHALAFHPRDDRFFLAGAKDAKLRLWSVPDKRVEYSANVADVITAVAFSPDGRTAMAGTVTGTIACYATDQRFRPEGSFVARGKKRCRVSAIEPVALHGADQDGECRLLVTTADSAVRVFDLRTKALVRKLKGHRNEELTMRASMTPDARHVVVASEDRAAYIWTLSDDGDGENNLAASTPSLGGASSVGGGSSAAGATAPGTGSGTTPVEYFEAFARHRASAALLAPPETLVRLARSADPVLDVCDPPPVMLVERAPSIASAAPSIASSAPTAPGAPSSQQSPGKNNASTAATSAPSAPATPTAAHGTSMSPRRPGGSGSTHAHGPIVVVASTGGAVRVFRQDCAAAKRRAINGFGFGARSGSASALSATSSSAAGGGAAPGDGASPATGRTYLRRALGGGSGGGSSSRSSVGSATNKNSSASISAMAGGGRPVSVHSLGASSARTGSVLVRGRHRRSGSVATTATTATMATAAMTPTAASFAAAASPSVGAPSSVAAPAEEERIERWREDIDAREGSVRTAAGDGDGPSSPATRTSSAANPLRLEGSQSFMFWNLSQYQDRRDGPHAAADDDGGEDEAWTERQTQNGKEGERRCPRCGGTSVREKETRSWGFAKTKSLVCGECGLEKKS